MNPLPFTQPEKPLTTPQEEFEHVGQNLEKYETPLLTEEEKDLHIKDRLKAYKNLPIDQTLAPEMQQPQMEQDQIVLDLAPETHDTIIEGLIFHLHERGILNTLNVVDKMNNPHVEDDFHRFLVEYIRKGYFTDNALEKTPLEKSLNMQLFEVAVPRAEKEEDNRKTLKELVSGMEQFYSGMLSVSRGKEDYHISLEIANSIGSDEFIFYISVPGKRADLFEKQLLSIFPHARISLSTNDYNIFNEEGASVGSFAKLSRKAIYPLRTYDEFDQDPLSVILNIFSKLDSEKEAAAIQLIFKPGGDEHLKAYSKAVDELRKGEKKHKALDLQVGTFGKTWKEAKKIFATHKPDEQKHIDTALIETLEKKVSTPIAFTNMRIVASSESLARAEAILGEIESSFNQFANTQGNSLKFSRVFSRAFNNFAKQFSFRLFDKSQSMPLSLREITTIIHIPTDTRAVSSQLRQAKSTTAPAPTNIPTSGVLIGMNEHRGQKKSIFMTPEDRLRHLYVIGQTGTGKSTLLRKLIIQDIENGEGCCFIDPHGSDVEDILSHIPKERYDDVIYFDPSNTSRPMSLNMLEYDKNFPEQKTFVVNEMISIFNKLFDMKTAGGPMFEQYFRNATMLVIDHPESGNTLLDISRVLSDKKFRDMKLANCKNPLVIQFWKEIAEKAGGEGSLQNIVPYITSKFDIFLSNDIMRPIVSQEASSIKFRDIMDSKKILLVNLAKGRLGDINSALLGLIIVGKILMAALSRVDSFGKPTPPFYLYIDEFQNVTTSSISTILSEARKYKLSLTIAHQFIAQLEDTIRDSVFGNVGSIVSYRVGAEDAEVLEKQFAPTFTARDIMNIQNLNAYVKMLANGEPISPFNVHVEWPPDGKSNIVEPLKELSALKYGRDRGEIETEIMRKYSTI